MTYKQDGLVPKSAQRIANRDVVVTDPPNLSQSHVIPGPIWPNKPEGE